MRGFENLFRRIAAMERAPSIPPYCGLEGLTDAELDEKIKYLIQRIEERGIMLNCLHRASSCAECGGNFRASWCYSWIDGEPRICAPLMR